MTVDGKKMRRFAESFRGIIGAPPQIKELAVAVRGLMYDVVPAPSERSVRASVGPDPHSRGRNGPV